MRLPRTRQANEKITYSMRVCIILLDVLLGGLIFILPGFIAPPLSFLHLYIPVGVVGYYTWFDVRGTTTWGKRCMGVRAYTKSGVPPRLSQRLLRAGLRWLWLPGGFLAWRRVSLLDTLSGTRLVRPMEVPLSAKDKDKNTKKKHRFMKKREPAPVRRAVH
jgi:uncharacterized RDD family membrane protein YckC